MVTDEFIDHISTVSFLSKIKRGEAVSRITFHEEELVSDHGDELRSNDIEAALEDLVGMHISALLTFPFSAVRPKEQN